MWKIFAMLVVGLAAATPAMDYGAQRFYGIPLMASFEKVNHKQARYKAIVRRALTSVGVALRGIRVLSLYAKNETYRTSYKVIYKNKKGETCFMKWSVLALAGSPNGGIPECSSEDLRRF